jgi:hypothetical protein
LNDVINDYINRANKFNNITNCGEQKPFFNGVECIKCNDPTPIFNISSSKCTACPVNTKYDQSTKNCTSTGSIPINATSTTPVKPNLASESPNFLLGANQTQKDIDAYLASSGS